MSLGVDRLGRWVRAGEKVGVRRLRRDFRLRYGGGVARQPPDAACCRNRASDGRPPVKSTLVQPRFVEFAFPHLDTLIEVETNADRVIVRATRDRFSEPRKRSFIRQIAAEGFIPAEYEWAPIRSVPAEGAVQWMVDISWLKLTEAILAPSRRFMSQLLVGGVVMWLVEMTLLFTTSV